MTWKAGFALPESVMKDIIFYCRYQETIGGPHPASDEANALICSALVLVHEVGDMAEVCADLLDSSDGGLLEAVQSSSLRATRLWRHAHKLLRHERQIKQEDIEKVAREIPAEVLDMFFQAKKIMAWARRIGDFIDPSGRKRKDITDEAKTFRAVQDDLLRRAKGINLLILRNRVDIEIRKSMLEYLLVNGTVDVPAPDVGALHARLAAEHWLRFEARLDDVVREHPGLFSKS